MNVLIVDDEKIIVDGIKLLAEQSGYDFDNIFTACSVAQALDIARNNRIDILFSDIRMPVMDGFEFINNIKRYCTPEIILISGYAEFEYAHQALNVGVMGYILKPIDEEQFFDILKRAVNKIATSSEKKPTYTDTQRRMAQLLQIMFGGGDISARDRQYLEGELAAESARYVLIMVNISIADKFDADIQTVLDEIQPALEQCFAEQSYQGKFWFFKNTNPNNLLCLCEGAQNTEQLERVCTGFMREFHSCIPVEIYISMSDVRTRLSQELYRHAQEAYYERFLDKNKHILKYRASNLQMASDIENKLKIVELNVANADMINLEKSLQEIFSVEYIKNSGLTVRAVYFLVANAVILTFNRIKVEISNTVVEEILSESYLRRIKNSVSELAEHIYNVILDVLLEQNQAAGTQMTIAKIVSYIEANFDKSLSVKQVSEMFGLTPNYLSQIFKKDVGENFVSYLNRLRIEKACKLLRQSNIKIFEIGSMVGYNDSQYFYRVFKKYMNQTPIEYRMNKK